MRSGTDGEGNASSDTDDTTEDNTGTSSVNSPPITDTTTIQEQISDIIQQEKEDDMSPLTLLLQDEKKLGLGTQHPSTNSQMASSSVSFVQVTGLFPWLNNSWTIRPAT